MARKGCTYCGHSKKWHTGSRILDSDNTECLHPTEGGEDECGCTSFTKENPPYGIPE